MTDQNPDNLKIKHEQKVAWDDSASLTLCAARSKVGHQFFQLAARTPEIRAQLREAMVNSGRAFAGADNVVRLNNETILFSAQA